MRVRSRWLIALTSTVISVVPAAVAEGQTVGPNLVVPSPDPSRVSIVADSFTPSTGARRIFRVYRPKEARGKLPVVLFANGTSADFGTWRGYADWARLVTTRGLAAVLYQGPGFDAQRSLPDNIATSAADVDSVVATIGRSADRFGVDPTNLVIWAGSAQTFTGTRVALTGDRPGIRGYVLYYGSGFATEPRVDVPVLMVRAGLDSPQLNRELDSLAARLTQAGVPVTMLSHPAAPHGFDVMDSTEATARVVATTLEFMAQAADRKYQAAVQAAGPAARASAAFASGRWADAERLYGEIARAAPTSRIAAWRLGLAQLEAGHPADALASFDRAKQLGQGGARDIGLPAARAALRAGATDRAVEWIKWALESFPRIRPEIVRDTELAPLLEHPAVRG